MYFYLLIPAISVTPCVVNLDFAVYFVPLFFPFSLK